MQDPIANLKLVVQFLLSLVTAVKQPLAANGKFGLRDLLSFAPVLKAFPPVSAFKSALSELENASDADRASLNAFIKEKFSIGNAQVEEKIEAGLSIAIKLSGFAPEVKTLLKKAEAALPAVEGQTQQVGTVNVVAEQVNVAPQA